MNLVVTKCEQAIKDQLALQVDDSVPIYISDTDGIKEAMPYIIVHGNSYEEQIGPGSGIYRIRIDCVFRSHVKTESRWTALTENPTDNRDAIIAQINNFLYSSPATALSAATGFHCYGFVPVSGDMRVQPDYKAYEYHTQFDVFCMPRDNA